MTSDSVLGVCCDWLTLVHLYPEGSVMRESGRTLKLDADGVIEWESQAWENIHCPSSDTSIRARCDGRTLRVTGNLGRYGRESNLTGYSVPVCADRARLVLESLGFDVTGFGGPNTAITRVDLAGNYQVDDYPGLCRAMSVRKVGRLLPILGRYGPTWGYGAARGGWAKAKLYDKSAELAGRRLVSSGATVARFEVELGGEWLRRYELNRVEKWMGDMGEVVFGKFADQVFCDSVSVEEWADLPSRLRSLAILWRDGYDLRAQMSKTAFYRNRGKLLEFGIDIGVPCNVLALTRRIRNVQVRQISALAA